MARYSYILFLSLACITVCTFSPEVVAQQKKTFKGSYSFYGFEGEAIYEYLRVSRDSLVKHGSFGFVRKHTDSLDLRIFNRLQATGNYLYDKKSGIWSYLESTNRVVIKDVVFFNVKAALESMQFETSAVYNASGIPHGVWRYKAIKYQNDKVTDLLNSSSLNFNNGSLSGTFSFTTDQEDGYYGLYSIQGNCTPDGFMDSLWTFRYVRDTIQIREKRFYESGFLKEVIKISDNLRRDTLFHMVDHATISKLAIVKNGQSSLFKISDRDFGVDYISGFDVNDKRYLTQTHGNKYLKEIMEAVTKFDTDHYFSGQEEVNWPIKTKRFEFAILPEEDTLRRGIQKNYQRIVDDILEVYLSPTFGLNYKRTDSLLLANTYFELIDSLLDRLNYVVQKMASDDYKYFDAYAYSNTQSFGFMTTDTIRISTNERTYIVAEDFNSGLEENVSLLERVNKYLNDLALITTTYKLVVNEQMKLIKIGEELESIQEKIVEERKSIKSALKERRYYSNEEKQLFNSLDKNLLDIEFEKFKEAYSKDELEAGKLDKGGDYLNLLKTFEGMFGPLGAIYPNRDILDSLYHEEVFNPFTFTSYKRRVQGDLFQKGEQLFDHYIAEIKSLNDYRELNARVAQIQHLQIRMKQLRTQDTRSLERGLRGRRMPSEIETLLKVPAHE